MPRIQSAAGVWVEGFAPTQEWESVIRVVEDSDPATQIPKTGATRPDS